MKYVDINKKFTEAVNEYITKGYAINTNSMRGSQGVARIDLTNGTEIIRVMLAEFNQFEPFAEGMEIIVGRYTAGKVVPHSRGGFDTIWNDELDVIKTERFYKVSSNLCVDYFGTQEDAAAATEVRLARWERRSESKQVSITSDAALKIAQCVIRQKLGIKRVITADVEIQKAKHGYDISYHGKTVALR